MKYSPVVQIQVHTKTPGDLEGFKLCIEIHMKIPKPKGYMSN